MEINNIKMRGLALLLTLVMCICLLPAAAVAADSNGTPLETTTVIEAGNTYTISNATELKAFKALVDAGNTFEGATVELLNDIDMNDGTSWYPIGVLASSPSSSISGVKPFSGELKGNGHSIIGLNYVYPNANTAAIGFFGKLSNAVVRDLKITQVGCNITNSSYYSYTYTGGLAAYADNSNIENCYVEGRLLAGNKNSGSSVPRMDYVGGLFGYLFKSTVKNCTNDLEYELRCGTYSSGSGSNVYTYFSAVGYAGGGIAAVASNSQILSCVNNARISIAGGDSYSSIGAGGIVGNAGSNLTVDRCLNTGEIVSLGRNSSSVYNNPSGGIVGCVKSGGNKITNCWNKGYVSGYEECVGGIVGLSGSTSTSASSSSYSGAQSPVTIFNCLNTGKIWHTNISQGLYASTATAAQADARGGIVGYVGHTNGAEIDNCYNQGTVIDGSTYSSARFSGGMVGHTCTGAYTLAYINHSYLLDQNDGLATSRWYTSQSGSKGVGYNSSCVKNYLSQMRESAEEHCAELNDFASKQSIWNASTNSGIVPEITQTEESRDYATWIYDSTGKFNKGLPYLDLSASGCSDLPDATEVAYTLHYISNAGSDTVDKLPESQSMISDTGSANFRISSNVPTRTGYKFLGWADTYDAEAAQYGAKGTVKVSASAPEKTLYAVWAKTHKVSWVDPYYASTSYSYTLKTATILDGETVPKSLYPFTTPPSYRNHTDSYFAGWAAPVEDENGDITIAANWRLNVVWMDGYTDVPVAADYIVKSGDVATATNNVRKPFRPGFKFKEWITAPLTSAGKIDVSTGNITVTATWEEKDTFSVTWIDSYDGEELKVSEGLGDISEAVNPSDDELPEHEGKVFDKWMESAPDENGDITIIATWKDDGSGSGSVSYRPTITWIDSYDGSVLLVIETDNTEDLSEIQNPDIETLPVHEGKEFDRWVICRPSVVSDTDSDDEPVYDEDANDDIIDETDDDSESDEAVDDELDADEAADSEITAGEGTSPEYGDVIIIAMWKDIVIEIEETYTVTWVDGFDNSVIDSKEFTVGEDVPVYVFPETPVHEDMDFDVWRASMPDVDGNITITASWKEKPPVQDKTYTVTWIDSSDNSVISNKEFKVGEDVPESEYPVNIPVHENMVFDGWEIGAPDEDGNIIITTLWKDVEDTPDETYTVTWIDSSDGSVIDSKEFKVGEDIPSSEYPVNVPVHEGMVFDGWEVGTPDEDGNIAITTRWKDAEDTSDETYTVTWIDGFDGSKLGSKEIKVGEDVSKSDYPSLPKHPNSTFKKWIVGSPAEDGSVIITATWAQRTITTSGGGGGVSGGGVSGGGSSSNYSSSGSNSTTTITDTAVPLAAAPGLNSEDHFAYIIGYEDNTVRPEYNITRGEVATIFFRLMTDDFRAASLSDENSFSDVATEDWYNRAISTGAKAGLINGNPDGTFAPESDITRAEFAAIAARFLSDEVTEVGSFSDIAGHWAENDIIRAVQAGWIKGNGDNTFAPDNYITRAEVMTLINRMLNRIGDADAMTDDMVKWVDNLESAWYYADVQEATNGHKYERDALGISEVWTEIIENRDWSALER